MSAEFLLYPVFEELRRQGVPLGISEYFIALEVMRKSGSNSLETGESLQRLCRLLWAKSREDQVLFDRVFEQEIIRRLDALPLPVQDLSNDEPIRVPPKPVEPELSGQTEPGRERPRHQSQPQRFLLPNEGFQGDTDLPNEPARYYQLTPRLPIDRRDMIGIWRRLRKFQREGPLEELDMQGTIAAICCTGLFIRPVLQPPRRNRARLVLLIDQSSSMEPFALIIEAFIESVLRSGLHPQIFYFGNYPGAYLFETPERTQARPLMEVLTNDCNGHSVLIISDAGAARGEYKITRIEKTKEFITALRENTYLYAWLNPMPIERWARTAAQDIREFVPMYHLDRNGVNDAVNILRGHPFPQEIRFHG